MYPDEVVFEGKKYRKGLVGESKRELYVAKSGGSTVYLHRVVWESTNGPIPDGHDVHHIDGDTLNWHLENLRCLTHDEHMALHYEARKANPLRVTCTWCKKEFLSIQPFAKYCSDACESNSRAKEGPQFGLTDEEICNVLAGMTDTQHRAILQILVDLGLSLDEILGNAETDVRGIYTQDFNLDHMTLTVESRFVKDDLFSIRTVPLTSHVVVAVQDYIYSMGKSFKVKDKLFDLTNRRVRQMLNEVGEKAELPFELSPAVCRRSAIVRMLKCHVPPSEVRKRLGFLKPREENMIVFALLTPTAPFSGLGYSDEMLAQAAGWSGFSAYKPEM